MTQEEVAALLVARGLAYRKPLTQTRCLDTIELRSAGANGNVYVTRTGHILTGFTMREARRVGPQTRRHMLGGDE